MIGIPFETGYIRFPSDDISDAMETLLSWYLLENSQTIYTDYNFNVKGIS